MSKFINTEKQSLIQNGQKVMIDKLLDNPFPFFVSEQRTLATYYNINEEYSIVDYKGTGDVYDIVGSNSPLKYDKYTNLPIAGMEKILAQIELDDMGIDGSDISGEITIFPDTIKAHVCDMFKIEYMKENLLFQITEVQYDTLDTGSNYCRVQYALYGTTNKCIAIEKQVIETYNVIIDNIGSTNLKAVIKSTYYDIINQWDELLSSLRKYFTAIFYDNKVQTFTYYNRLKQSKFYDAYMIEFLKRNALMNGSDFIYVAHQTYLDPTFSLDYENTAFRAIEKGDKNKLSHASISCIGEEINDINSIFNTRFETYYSCTYKFHDMMVNFSPMNTIEADLIKRILSEEYYEDKEKEFLNIIIKHFNGIDLNEDDSKSLDNIEYTDHYNLFYYIPLIMFSIEQYIKRILHKHLSK